MRFPAPRKAFASRLPKVAMVIPAVKAARKRLAPVSSQIAKTRRAIATAVIATYSPEDSKIRVRSIRRAT